MNGRLRVTGWAILVGCFAVTLGSARYEQQKIEKVEQQLGSFLKKSDFELQFINLFVSNSIWVNSDGKITSASPGAAKLFGYTPNELKGKAVVDLMPEAFRPKHEAGFSRTMSEKKPADPAVVIETVCDGLRKDNTTFPVEIRTRLMDSDAGRLGVSLFTEKNKIVQAN